MLAMSSWLVFVFHHRTSGKRKTPFVSITYSDSQSKANLKGGSMLSALGIFGNDCLVLLSSESCNFDKAEQ